MTTVPKNALCEVKVEIGTGDVHRVDELLLESGHEKWSVFEDVVANRAWLLGIFETEVSARADWEELSPHLGGLVAADLTFRTLLEEEWRDSYKAHFRAWQFGRLHWVPEWERSTYRPPEGDAVLWLDPGLAFGTGNHETTRLCVERLVEHATAEGIKGTVVDAGCGSGILALSAAKLGYGDVRGFDNDPEAIRVSLENASANGLERQVQFHVGDLTTGLADVRADVVLANILANVLVQFAPELTRAVSPGGRLVLSGILQRESDQVLQAFLAVVPSWKHTAHSMGEWSDVVLIRPPL